jgi:carbon starvation protein CstA
MVTKENIGHVIFSKIEDACFVAMVSFLIFLTIFSGSLILIQLPRGDSWDLTITVFYVAVSLFLGIILLKWKNAIGTIAIIATELLVMAIVLSSTITNSERASLAIASIVTFAATIGFVFKKRIILDAISIFLLLIVISIYSKNLSSYFTPQDGVSTTVLILMGVSVLIGFLPTLFDKNKKIREYLQIGSSFAFVPSLIFVLYLILKPLPEGAVQVEGPVVGLFILSGFVILPSIIYGAFGGLVGYSIKWLIVKIKARISAKQKP